MKKLILINILLFAITSVFSQGPTNATNKNVYAWFPTAKLSTNDDECLAFEQADHDDGGITCVFFDDYVIRFDLNEVEQDIWEKQGNGPGTIAVPDDIWEMVDKSNQTSASYEFRADIWESDDDNTTWDHPIDEFGCGDNTETVDIFALNPGVATSNFLNCPNSINGATVKYLYRFSKGDDIANALTFGALEPDQDKTHLNRVNTLNSIPSSGISTAIKYTNTIDDQTAMFTNDNEVIYKFNVNSENPCLMVDIRAEFISSSSGPGVKVASLNGNQIDTYLGGETGSSTFTHTFPESSDGYVVVIETDSDDAFDLYIEPSWSDITAGSIVYGGSLTGPDGYNPPVISNDGFATGSFTGYQWEHKGPADGSFEIISGATDTSYDPGPLNLAAGNPSFSVHKFRRAAINSSCEGVDEYTDVVEIVIQNKYGEVSGDVKVDDMLTNSCTGSGIENATVTITNLEELTGGIEAGSIVESVQTGALGDFSLPKVYVGDNPTQWKVTAEFFDHDIIPDADTITLSTDQPIVQNLCFEDNESFICSGNVFHDFQDLICGKDTVELNLIDSGSDALVGVTYTNLDGDYLLTVPYTGDFEIVAILGDHTFNQHDGFFINSDTSGINIEDLTYRTVSFSFLGGCESIIGSLSFDLHDTVNCHIIPIVTNPSTGYFEIDLPAKKYIAQNFTFTPLNGASFDFTNTFVDTEIESYFENLNIRVDLTSIDSSLQLIYHPNPVLDVLNWPEPPPCTQEIVGANVPYGVINASDEIELTLKAWDISPGLHPTLPLGCPLDTGVVYIEDQVRSLDGVPVFDTLTVDSVDLYYTLESGVPNIVSPFNKYAYFNLSTIDGTVSQYPFTVIAEGVRARENTFTTVSPELPLLILRDPPGDNSFASFIEGESLTTINTISTSISGGVEITAAVVYEKEIELIGLAAEASIGGSVGVSGGNVSTESTEVTSTITSEYSTSANENPNSIGESADIMMGLAYNIIYALSDVVRFNQSICEVVRTTDLLVNPDSIPTTYVYPVNTVVNNIVPSLLELKELSTDPDDIMKYDDQINIWEEHLEYNRTLKDDAVFQKNFSYGAGAVQTHTEEITTTQSKSSEWHQSLDLSVFATGKFLLQGLGAEGSIVGTFNLTETQDTTNIESSTFVTSYTLDDNDNDGAGDLFTVDVLKDEVYGVPVFDLAAAETSCPYEEGTLPRHDATLVAVPSTQFNVPTEDGATFTLILSNVSQSGETMSYFLDYNSASNFDGADVSYNEVYEGNRIELAFGQSFTFTGITIFPNQSNGVYSYEGIEFRVHAACLDGGNEYVPDQSRDIASALLNVYFVPPCNGVNMDSPDDTWISSTTINENLPVSFSDYDFATITSLKLQYKEIGSSTWLTGQVYDINSFNPNSEIGSTFDWNTNVIPDGAYKIRLNLGCGSDIISTVPIEGIIDKTPPRKIGFPKPSSRKLESLDDLIGITFSETIDPNTDHNNIEITNVVTGNPVEFDISVIDNKVVLSPLLDLSTLAPAIYRIDYTGIEDLYGNEIEAPITWTFSVGEISVFNCDENTVLYVDENVPPGGRLNGLSWEDAFTNLTDAMNTACPESSIYVAEGSYFPTDYLYSLDSDVFDTIPGDSIYFNWKRNFNWYGGFPTGGGDFEDRNPELYPTILSGDANKDSIRNAGDCNMLLKINPNVEGRMEGFILEEIYTDESIGLPFVSGAVYNEGDVEVVNCIFRNNEIVYTSNPRGGAWFNLTGSPTFANCIFHDNEITNRGAAVYLGSISPTTLMSIVNCTFYNHTATTDGSTIWSNGDDLEVVNSIFYDNILEDLKAVSGGQFTVEHCSLEESSTPSGVIDGGNNLFSNDPLFVDAPNGNFLLTDNSTCKDAGENELIEQISAFDIAHNARIINTSLSLDGIVDMGAYELGPCGDVTTETILHVDQSVLTEGNGFLWSTPFKSLAKALTKATLCGIDTILVAEGIYLPESADPLEPRLSTFEIPSGMYIAGGYPSGGGVADAVENLTMLSGNIGSLTDESDNVYHVVTIPNTFSPTTIEGFTIMGGNADAVGHLEGGGILHRAVGYGISSKPLVKNCIIKYNSASQGGGLANIGDDLAEASIKLINTTIRNNNATINGGGILDRSLNQGVTQMTIQNGLIYENKAMTSGGGIYHIAGDNSQTQSTIRNATIVNNTCGVNASGDGGGLNLNQSATGIVGSKVYNSIIYGNIHAGSGPNQIWQTEENSMITMKNNNIEGGYGTPELMEYNLDTLPYFVGAHVGNFGLDACSPLLDKGDDAEIDLAEDILGEPRKVGTVDIGALEYDGESRRGNLPETLDDIVINCVNQVSIPLPSDGVTYALYNDTLTLLIAGPDVGDIPNKKMYSTSQIVTDTTLSMIVGRDASFGVDLEGANGVIEFGHNDIQNFDHSQYFSLSARVNPTTVVGTKLIWHKEENLGVGFSNSNMLFSIYNHQSVSVPLNLTINEWQDVFIEYNPISATEGLLIAKKNGEETGRALINRNSDSSTNNLYLGGAYLVNNFSGKIDYLAAQIGDQPIIQLDFLSAQGSDKAFDMRLAADGGAAQEGMLNGLNRYEIWLEGEDSYVKLCPDTLTLNILIDPETKTHFVESHLDEGYLTLREKVFEACPNDTIRFANVMMGDTVKFESEILLDKNLYIEGLGMNGGITLDGQGFTRLFNTNVNTTITYKDLEMINGSHPFTGGATPISSDCTLWNVAFKNNNATGNGKSISLLPFSNLKVKGSVLLND